jgi:drug/metabolite transporter (DMT)-like permease
MLRAMRSSENVRGAAMGLLAAVLFGVSAPLAKELVPATGPILLAGILYLGGGLALVATGWAVRGAAAREAQLVRSDWPLVAGIIVCGGMLGPALMLAGVARLSGVASALLLNLEAPFTILLAVTAFGEHLGPRALGASLAIVAGAALLGLPNGEWRAEWLGILAIAGACASWAVDNNLTQRLSLKDPISVVRLKALGAGAAMIALGVATGARPPSLRWLGAALLLGALSYGASIVLDFHALRLLGAAREAAYFATAPFIGAVAAVPLLGDRLGPAQLGAGALMAAGVALLIRERHGHVHTHAPLEHEHLHVHDEHHRHAHEGPADLAEPHSHPHVHAPLTHDHPHVPDLHHRHPH